MGENEEIQLPVDTDKVAEMLTEAIDQRVRGHTTRWQLLRVARSLMLIPMSCIGSNCEVLGALTETECVDGPSSDKWDELVTEAAEKINESE